jgi:hypothetical protein
MQAQRFFLRVCPLPLGSCDSLAGRTPLKGLFHKSFNTSCHSSPLMTRRVNFTSAKTVSHRMAMPMLKPKKISMMGIIRLWCHNRLGRQYALQRSLKRAAQPALHAPGATLSRFNHCRSAPSMMVFWLPRWANELERIQSRRPIGIKCVRTFSQIRRSRPLGKSRRWSC